MNAKAAKIHIRSGVLRCRPPTFSTKLIQAGQQDVNMGSGPSACSPCPSSAAACGCSPAAACLASAAGAAAAAAAAAAALEPLLVCCARLSSDCACQRALRRCSSSVPGQ